MDILARIKEVAADKLDVDVEEISLEKSFVDDLGADSLDVVELIMGLEDEFGLEISDEEAEKLSTVGEAVKFIEIKITMKRVVITGLGPVTSIGIGAEAFLEAQREAKNGIRIIQTFDAKAEGLGTHIASEIDIDVLEYIDRKEAKRIDRYIHFALIGAELAIQDANLTTEEIAGEHAGACVGTGIGGIQTWENTIQNTL